MRESTAAAAATSASSTRLCTDPPSLTNPNTGLGTCSECHRKYGDLPPLEKFAFKVRAGLRKLNEYFWYEGRPNPPERFSVADLIEELNSTER